MDSLKYDKTISFIKSLFGNKEFIPLHEPKFIGNEIAYLTDTITSTYVSSVGKYVDRFEEMMQTLTSSKHAIAVVNGTSALHISLLLSNVKAGDLVITQPLSFVATTNAISYCGATPAFVDIDEHTLGMSPQALKDFLDDVKLINGTPIHLPTNRKVGACVPMHTFGLPCEIDKIVELCTSYNIPVIEDAAESIGSMYKGRSTGTFGLFGTISFNGNKTITCGGGGIILTSSSELAFRAKHITTQAKIPHKWEFKHDAVGFNYRCPNLNAALACAQLESLDLFISDKRKLASIYADHFAHSPIKYVVEGKNAFANYWLNAVILPSFEEREEFLLSTNSKGVMTRPVWSLLNTLPFNSDAICYTLSKSKYFADRIVNIPSSVRF